MKTVESDGTEKTRLGLSQLVPSEPEKEVIISIGLLAALLRSVGGAIVLTEEDLNYSSRNRGGVITMIPSGDMPRRYKYQLKEPE